MKIIFYNPKSKMMYTQDYKNPWYYILKLRCDCFRISKYGKFGSRFARKVIENGGLEEISYVVSDSIPFYNNEEFVSYDGQTCVEEWLKLHPGEAIEPIRNFEELNIAIMHRHDWDKRKDMYE